LRFWDKGWERLFKTLDEIKPDDLEKIIYIRNEGHTVMEAINRQLAHYPYHVGQIVYIAKMIKSSDWEAFPYQEIDQKIIIPESSMNPNRKNILRMNF